MVSYNSPQLRPEFSFIHNWEPINFKSQQTISMGLGKH